MVEPSLSGKTRGTFGRLLRWSIDRGCVVGQTGRYVVAVVEALFSLQQRFVARGVVVRTHTICSLFVTIPSFVGPRGWRANQPLFVVRRVDAHGFVTPTIEEFKGWVAPTAGEKEGEAMEVPTHRDNQLCGSQGI